MIGMVHTISRARTRQLQQTCGQLPFGGSKSILDQRLTLQYLEGYCRTIGIGINNTKISRIVSETADAR